MKIFLKIKKFNFTRTSKNMSLIIETVQNLAQDFIETFPKKNSEESDVLDMWHEYLDNETNCTTDSFCKEVVFAYGFDNAMELLTETGVPKFNVLRCMFYIIIDTLVREQFNLEEHVKTEFNKQK